jgi:hypothetical protein
MAQNIQHQEAEAYERNELAYRALLSYALDSTVEIELRYGSHARPELEAGNFQLYDPLYAVQSAESTHIQLN